MENAASKAFDIATLNTISLARVEAGSVAKVKSFLAGLEVDLVGILAENKDLSPGKKAKLETILSAASTAIGGTYGNVQATHADDLAGLSKVQSAVAVKMVNSGIGASVFGPVLTESQLTKVAAGNVFGHSSKAWWDSQEASLQHKFAGQIRQGYALGEDVDTLTRRIRGTKANGFKDGIMSVSRREAEALVRSSIQTISNEARLASFEAMGETIKGIEWVSTLDTRTTAICKALDGKVWTFPGLKPFKHDKVFPGPTAHWNCRSTQIPVLRTWAELSGKKIKALDDDTFQAKLQAKLKAKGMDDQKVAMAVGNARASMDGQASGSPPMDDWLKGKSDADVKKILGPGRAKLWNQGKITVTDLTDQNNRPLTIAQLQAAVDAGDIPVETEGTDFDAFDKSKLKSFSDKDAIAAHEAAKAKIQSVLDNPKEKGNSILATNLAKIQADEPSLTPAETLAKAEELTAAKIAANTKSSVLSKAKKKILAGEEPTAAQKALIDSLGDDEKAAWDEAVGDAQKLTKKAQAQTVKVDLKSKIDAALAKNPFADPYKTDLLNEVFDLGALDMDAAKDVEDYVVAEFAAKKAAAVTLKKGKLKSEIDKQIHQFGAMEPDFLDILNVEGLDPADVGDIHDHFHATVATVKAQAKVDEWSAHPTKKFAIDQALEDFPDAGPAAILAAAESNLTDIVATDVMTNGTAASQKAVKALTGMNGPTAASVKAWMTANNKSAEEFLTEWQTLTKEKADQSVKSSILSKAKKKAAAGEELTPGQMKVWNDLTSEEKHAFDDDVEAMKSKVQPGQAVPLIKPAITPPPAAAFTAPSLGVPDPASMTFIQTLSGSTRPQLMEDASGKKWVVKSPDQGGGGRVHLENEAAADQIYRVAGAAVPKSQFVDVGGKPYKVAEYLEGAKTLGDWERTASVTDKLAMHAKISDHFVMDALMGNWDVLGQSNDNVMILPNGTPIRVDNGGALDFRAQGGKKTAAEWNGTVAELKTLRDPSKAAGKTAQVFSGLTDADIHLQIADLVGKRDELIEAVRTLKGDTVADVFAARLDYLKAQLPASFAKSTPAAAQARQDTFSALPADIPKRIDRALVNGHSVAIGTTHVEDMQGLAWVEKAKDGSDLTVTHLKLTDEGSDAVLKTIGKELGKAAPTPTAAAVPAGPQTSGPIPDAFTQKWVSMAKTLNTHAKDGAFNPGTVQIFTDELAKAKTDLASMKADKSAKSAIDKAKVAQLEHFIALGDDLAATHKALVDGHAAGSPPTVAVPFVPATQHLVENFQDDPSIAAENAKKAAAQKKIDDAEKARIAALPKPDFTVTQSEFFEMRTNVFTNGNARNEASQKYKAEAGVYTLKFSDDTEVTFVPRSGRFGSQGSKSGLAMEGIVQIRIPAAADHDSVMKTFDTLQKMGVNTTEASADYREMTWLKKTVYLKNDHAMAGWKKIEGMDNGPAQIAAARAWMESRYSVQIPKRGDAGFTADGVSNSFGDGFRHVYRADLTRAQAEKDMAGFTLIHQTYGSDITASLDAMLGSGGEATTTTGRLRKGVPIGGTGGMSATADMGTGGADFFFTRIRKTSSVPAGSFMFKVGNIARADAVSYTTDLYGKTGDRTHRRTTVDEFKKIAGTGSNDETIFKNGLFILDELEGIKARSLTHRGELIAVFKKHGISVLPDGRKVEDVVTI